jgi:tetratricopeptide (TPR) repeat protein
MLLSILFVVLGVTVMVPISLAAIRNGIYVSYLGDLIMEFPRAGTEEQGLLEHFGSSVSTFEQPEITWTKPSKLLTHSYVSQNASWLRVQYLLGFAKLMEGDLRSAIVRLSSTDEKKDLTSLLLGVALHLSGQHDAAIDVWRRANDIERYFLRIGSRALYVEHKPLVAASNFSIAHEIAPHLCEPLYREGLALNEVNDRIQAVNIWSKAEDMNCADTDYLGELLYVYGKSLSELGEHTEAIGKLEKSVSLNPKDVKRLLLLGYELEVDGNTKDRARRLYKQALEIEPRKIEPYLALCRLELGQANYGEALSWCEQAVKRFPDNAWSYHYMGMVFFEKGDYENAVLWLTKAIEKDSSNVNTWIRLGQAYASEKNFDMALHAYLEALNIDPDNSYIQTLIKGLPGSD